MYSVIGDIPKHQYVWVDSKFTHKKAIGFIPAVWFGLVSIPGRMWGCNVMLESGAVYRNIPPHAIAFTDKCSVPWKETEAQEWDCYGERFSTLEYKYLAPLECKTRIGNREYIGQYLFSAIPIGDGFSAYPEQAKEFTFIRLLNGRLTIQPTNNVIFIDRSFTNTDFKFPKDLRKQTEIYSCE